MDNEVSEHMLNMPEPRMAYVLNRRLFENAFEVIKNKFRSGTVKISLETKFKINVYLYTVKTELNKTLKRNSKAVQEKIYTSTDKVWSVVSLAARNNGRIIYRRRNHIIIGDFRLIPYRPNDYLLGHIMMHLHAS